MQKVAALANVFRSYGIKIYLSVYFPAPKTIGDRTRPGLKTADPLDHEVNKWWVDKANEIYKLIPDFGGFLVKANSEGQPGPQNYGRNHADGANKTVPGHVVIRLPVAKPCVVFNACERHQ